MPEQLSMFAADGAGGDGPTLSLSDRLARISALLETELGLAGRDLAFSTMPFASLMPSGHVFLSGRTLRGSSPRTVARIFGRLSDRLPTSGATDLSGNCLTRSDGCPRTASGCTLSDILQGPGEVSARYFLSEEAQARVLARAALPGGEKPRPRLLPVR